MSTWIDVAAVEEIEPGGCVVVDFHGTAVAVFNIDGEFLAVEDECSHESYPLSDGDVQADTVTCALHGAQFSLRTGEALSAPAVEPVTVFPVRVENGRLQMRESRGDLTDGVIHLTERKLAADAHSAEESARRHASTPFSTLRLGSEFSDRLGALACAGYPEETCGLLLGRCTEHRVDVLELVQAHNLNREQAQDRYELDPDALLAADIRARAQNWEIVGIWHSHPDHPARPSATDRARAWEGWSYVIVSVDRGHVADLRSWRLHQGDFKEEVLQ